MAIRHRLGAPRTATPEADADDAATASVTLLPAPSAPAEDDRLAALREISAFALLTVEPAPLLALVSDRATAAFRVDATVACVVEPDGQALARTSETSAAALAPFMSRLSADGALLSSVLRHGTRGVVHDLRSDPPSDLADLCRSGFSSALAAPLLHDARPIGALVLLSREPGRFAANDTPLALAFASSVAVAIETHRRFRDARASRDETEALAQMSRELSESLNLPELLDVILRKTMLLAGADLAYIALTQADGTARSVAAVGHRMPAFENAFVRPGCGIAGLALSTGQVVEISDDVGDSFSGENHPAALAEGVRSVLVFPLTLHGRTVGLLWIGRRSAEAFTGQTKARLLALGTSAAIALENARLYNEVAQKNTELEIANTTLAETLEIQSEFLTNISHEMRTPLSSILGLLRLILDGLCENRSEEQAFVAEAHASAQHLLTVINDLLDLTKMEAGKLKVEFEPVDLRALVDEVFAILRVQANTKGLKLTFASPDAACLDVQADSARLKQVLLNLVGNGVKFTDEGEISVRATASPEKGFVTIEVSDTGIGIAPSRQARLFQKFVQADGSTTRKYGGTGLGLAISKHLVEIMGGIIALRSAGEGQGTTVTISLPLSKDPGARNRKADAPPSSEVQGPNETPLILVVDDSPGIREVVCEYLHGSGFQTTQASTADEALDLAARLHPALALVDLALSCPASASLRTGVDLIEALIRKPDLRELPVILLTGAPSEAGTLLQNLDAPVSLPILEKPLDFDRLHSTIAIALAEAARRSTP